MRTTPGGRDRLFLQQGRREAVRRPMDRSRQEEREDKSREEVGPRAHAGRQEAVCQHEGNALTEVYLVRLAAEPRQRAPRRQPLSAHPHEGHRHHERQESEKGCIGPLLLQQEECSGHEEQYGHGQTVGPWTAPEESQK